jgi:hypothetical protein
MYSVIWKHAKQLKQSKNTWPSQNGQVQNDWEGFFDTYPKWVFLDQNFKWNFLGILVMGPIHGHQIFKALVGIDLLQSQFHVYGLDLKNNQAINN